HFHQSRFDLIGGFCWFQTQGKCLTQRVTFADEGLGFFTKFVARIFEFRHFVRVERTDNKEAGAVLKFVKAHRVAPSGRHKSSSGLIPGAFSPCPVVYSFLRRFRADSSREKMPARWLVAARAGAFRSLAGSKPADHRQGFPPP